MPAATDHYVDPAIDAASGTGTIGDPYGDLQYALDTLTKGVDGNRINIKAGTAEVLTAALSLATYGTPTSANHLTFRGYTASAADGGTGEIDCNGFALFGTTAKQTALVDLKIGNSGTNILWSPGEACFADSCEFYNGGASSTLIDTAQEAFSISRCYLHSETVTDSLITIDFDHCLVDSNFFDAGASPLGVFDGIIKGNSAALDYTTIVNNIIRTDSLSTNGIYLTGTGTTLVMNNSLYNSGSAGGSGGFGIGGALHICFVNNVIVGWSGAGCVAIPRGGISPMIVAGNLFYANTKNYVNTGDPALREYDNNQSRCMPYTDVSNNDFTVTSEARESAITSIPGLSTPNYMEVGALQR